MSLCTACGSENPDNARFCSQCGTPLAKAASSDSTATIQIGSEATDTSGTLSPVDAATVDALPPGSGMLVVQRGPGSGSRFLLDQDVVRAGRHPESDIFLDDVTVSRRHAEFTRAGVTYEVSDVGSLNGTYVNRDRIDRVTLTDGDEVQIGKFRLVFYAGHEPA